MNTLQLQKFSTFLCKNNYKVHTIELYSKSLIEFKPTPHIKVKIRLPKLLQISGYINATINMYKNDHIKMYKINST